MSDPKLTNGEESAVALTVPPVDVIEDLHGDPLTADLVLFLNGNQFMVMEELLTAFHHPLRFGGVDEAAHKRSRPHR